MIMIYGGEAWAVTVMESWELVRLEAAPTRTNSWLRMTNIAIINYSPLLQRPTLRVENVYHYLMMLPPSACDCQWLPMIDKCHQ